AGGRWLSVVSGVRGRVPGLPGWSMRSFAGELGFRVTLRRFEPFMSIAAGYTGLGGLQDGATGAPLSLDGLNARLGIGLDYFLTRFVSVGGVLSGEALAFTRSGVPLTGGAS